MRSFFLLVLVAAAAFVWVTSGALPSVVASHFGPGGQANGFMAKGSYTVLILSVVVAAPALVASLALLAHVLPPQLVNLPNKDYWLSPEQREASLDALASLGLRFAAGLAVFLCFVHWLLVRANSVQPPALREEWLFGGLALFGAATLFWIFSLYRRFSRVR
jgi:uncharacterized membrane protein